MELLNEKQTDALFDREAVMIGGRDVVPAARVVELFGEEALAFVKRREAADSQHIHFGTYSVAGLSVDYVNVYGFRDAVTCYNVFALNGKSAKAVQP